MTWHYCILQQKPLFGLVFPASIFAEAVQRSFDGWFESFQSCFLSQPEFREKRPFHIKWRYENVRSRAAQRDSGLLELYRVAASEFELFWRPPALRSSAPPNGKAQPQFQDWQVFRIMSGKNTEWSEQLFGSFLRDLQRSAGCIKYKVWYTPVAHPHYRNYWLMTSLPRPQANM